MKKHPSWVLFLFVRIGLFLGAFSIRLPIRLVFSGKKNTKNIKKPIKSSQNAKKIA